MNACCQELKRKIIAVLREEAKVASVAGLPSAPKGDWIMELIARVEPVGRPPENPDPRVDEYGNPIAPTTPLTYDGHYDPS